MGQQVIPEWGCLKVGSVGRDLGSQVEAFELPGLARLDCAYGAGGRPRHPYSSSLLGQEVWVWLRLAEWGQDQGAHMGQEKVLDSGRDGWPLRGHFLPGNILLGNGRERAPVQEGRKGLGLKSLVPSPPKQGLGSPRRE